MAGAEREFVGIQLGMLPSASQRSRYPDNASMRDFWRTSDRDSIHESIQESERAGQAIGDLHHMEEHGLRPYSFVDELAKESANMEVQSTMGTHHEFFERHPYLNLNASSSHALGALLPATAYANFINGTYPRQPEMKPTSVPFTTNEDQMTAFSLAPIAHDGADFPNLQGGVLTQITDSMNRDMETLQRELVFKCPRSSEILMAITTSADDILQGRCGSGPSSDEDGNLAPGDQEQVSRESRNMRAAIIDHPFYPELILAHVNLFKVGAPKGLRIKLNDLTKQFQRFQCGETSNVGDDPELDYFMEMYLFPEKPAFQERYHIDVRAYVDLLSKFRQSFEDPFNKFMAFKDDTTRQLEDLCGHYVETIPEEDDNFGYDIGPMDGAQDYDDDLEVPGGELGFPMDIDHSVVIDPMAPDEELKKVLFRRYGRYIGGLKAEFLRVRKKGKLPSAARQVLKEWFNRHAFWPYPSEVEKAYLQRVCDLNLKQINNWFINERKRHWSCEGKCMHPNTKFYSGPNSPGGSQGTGPDIPYIDNTTEHQHQHH